MNSKKKQKRRRQGKAWVANYSGNKVVIDYQRKFKVEKITAINDLQAIGVDLDPAEVARVKIDRHFYGYQQMKKSDLKEAIKTLKGESEIYDEFYEPNQF
ncbi:hypothetical protein [Microbulbifer sp.]|uniref:hypothetical protein n=1 Tax=Microbulbifer sp. TaxID=1908541 RepID=UPI003F394A28